MPASNLSLVIIGCPNVIVAFLTLSKQIAMADPFQFTTRQSLCHLTLCGLSYYPPPLHTTLWRISPTRARVASFLRLLDHPP